MTERDMEPIVNTIHDTRPTTKHLSASTPGRAAGSVNYACPYCDDAGFLQDSSLWSHVSNEHSQALEGLGLQTQGGVPLFKKLLKDEALRKAQRSTTLPRDAAEFGEAGEATVARALRRDPQSQLHVNAYEESTWTRLKQPRTVRAYSDASSHKTASQRGEARRSRSYASEHVSHGMRGPTAYNLGHFDESDGKSDDLAEASVSAPITYKNELSENPKSKTNRFSQAPDRPTLNTLSRAQNPARPSSEAQDTYMFHYHEEPEPELLLQPDSRPISQAQLTAEVKNIYAGLTMVETKCIDVYKAQGMLSKDQDPLASDYWKALISLHRTLLHEHHDFFLASQHPSANPALQRLAMKYSMPARMWKHGIHSFLELLRRRLPDSLDYMLSFIYLAYQMVALLYETVPAFEETWIECLGDLGRYRMAIEDDDLRDREIWAGVAKSWYLKATDKNAAIGRLYHHLAILARPHALQQLYFYARSMVCVESFPSARESVLTLIDPFLGLARMTYTNIPTLDAVFIRTHGTLFKGTNWANVPTLLDEVNTALVARINDSNVNWIEPGIYIAVTNIASLFEYGKLGSDLRKMYEAAFHAEIADASKPLGMDTHSSQDTSSPEHSAPTSIIRKLESGHNAILDFGLQLLFRTFQTVLRRKGDKKDVLPHVHVLLVFLRSLLFIESYVCGPLLARVPWLDLAHFLNTLEGSKSWGAGVQRRLFPDRTDNDQRPLPEDFLIRGQIWTLRYFPMDWFEAPIDADERRLEHASTTKSRVERILALAEELKLDSRVMQYLDFAEAHGVGRAFQDLRVGSPGERIDSMALDREQSDAMDVEMEEDKSALMSQAMEWVHVEEHARSDTGECVHGAETRDLETSPRRRSTSF